MLHFQILLVVIGCVGTLWFENIHTQHKQDPPKAMEVSRVYAAQDKGVHHA